MKEFIKKHIGTAVRHGLAWLGAILAAKGYASEESVQSLAAGITEILTGAVIMLGSMVWSYWHNRKIAQAAALTVQGPN